MTFAFIPIVLFLVSLLIIGLKYKVKSANGDFEKNYFLANRNLGGFVLAMSLVATYGSVSSFVSGPGLAWQFGYSWVVFAAPQIITGFLVLGVVGKKIALITSKSNSTSIVDIIYHRFGSKLLCIVLSVALIVFYMAMIVGQFIGGAQIFVAFTNLSFTQALILFAIVTIIYTSSGFKAVAITDTICAIFMLFGMFALGYIIYQASDGIQSIFNTINHNNLGEDGISNNLKANSGGALSYPLILSSWILVGFGTLALPQSLVRCMSYKKTQDLHKAMIIATIVCGCLMVGMTLLGVLSQVAIRTMPKGGTDSIIPTLISQSLNPIIAGITIIGPLAATMSTVSSLLIASSSALLQDLYKFSVKSSLFESKKGKILSKLITLALGIFAIILASYKFSIVVWINLFAFGGLESAFLCTFILGLFFPSINKNGACIGFFVSIGVYLLLTLLKVNILGFHNIVFSFIFGLLASFVGSRFGKPIEQKTMELFFPQLIK